MKKLKNPLRKRYSKELKQDFGKYLVIFIFMAFTIAFVSGFLVADNSMKTAYDESFTKYNMENGNFELKSEIKYKLVEKLESEQNIKVYDNRYVEENVLTDETLRIFVSRSEINKASIHEGTLPQNHDQIAIDRLYAANNKLSVGDTLTIADKKYKICGLVALSDYSAMFRKNSDFMFDANKFGVAVVTETGFQCFGEKNLHYNYSWLNNESYDSDRKEKEHSDNIKKIISENAMISGFIARKDNQSIQFTGEDMGSDKAMMMTLLYIVIVIMAFIFAVTINNTIESESSVIGTLRASGYKRGELLRHYLTLPMMVTLVAAIIGNVLGYTYFKYIVTDMYYNSYCLPVYKTIWNWEAFLLTTVIPCCIMVVVNICILIKKLALSPLKFLRHDLKKEAKRGAMKLPELKFMTRFRIRVILQNKSNYLIMLIGVLFANLLLMFGMIMAPLLAHYKEDVQNNMISSYQYILKAPAETNNSHAEKYAVTTLDSHLDKTGFNDKITVYGIQENSEYFNNMSMKSDETGVYASDGYMEKHGLDVGDSITLKDSYDDTKAYSVKIIGSYHYPAILSVFMNIEQFNKMFKNDSAYFNGYFSDAKLSDIDENYVASCIKEADLTNMVEQMQTSMGQMFYLVCGFAVILYMMLIYLLSKIVIEKNASAISMVKILGYNNKEVSRLYLVSTAVVVVISVLISLPVSYEIMKVIYVNMMSSFGGWLSLYIKPAIYVEMFVIGVVSYTIIAMLQMKKIKKIPMEEALKNGE